MVIIEHVYLTFVSNHSGFLETTEPAKYGKTAKILSDVIRDRIEKTGCKYVGNNCTLKLKLPNDIEVSIVELLEYHNYLNNHFYIIFYIIFIVLVQMKYVTFIFNCIFSLHITARYNCKHVQSCQA